jgi:FtsZ-interacting cell division protein ZipA
MPDWAWLLIAAIVVIALLAFFVARSAKTRNRSKRLKERFGPEYERTLDATGKQSEAEEVLAAREHRREQLNIVALTPQAREQYTSRWRAVQTAFIDNPSTAVGDADRLVIEVMRKRGYPIEDFDQRAADLSVDHPTVVENYRAAHHISQSQHQGNVDTEQERQAFVHYRALFEKLLETDTNHQEARA